MAWPREWANSRSHGIHLVHPEMVMTCQTSALYTQSISNAKRNYYLRRTVKDTLASLLVYLMVCLPVSLSVYVYVCLLMRNITWKNINFHKIFRTGGTWYKEQPGPFRVTTLRLTTLTLNTGEDSSVSTPLREIGFTWDFQDRFHMEQRISWNILRIFYAWPDCSRSENLVAGVYAIRRQFCSLFFAQMIHWDQVNHTKEHQYVIQRDPRGYLQHKSYALMFIQRCMELVMGRVSKYFRSD